MSSRFRNVCWDKIAKTWRAYICHEGKTIKVGNFDKEEDAAKQFDRCASPADIPLYAELLP